MMNGMYTEQAIREAVKGGYGGGVLSHEDIEPKAALLERAFWVALGKARGWVDTSYPMSFGKVSVARDRRIVYRKDWIKNWHRFIDHLADGKDAESFFKALLPTNSENV